MTQRLVSRARFAIVPLAVLFAGCEVEVTPSALEGDPALEERAAEPPSEMGGLYQPGAACTKPTVLEEVSSEPGTAAQELYVPLAELRVAALPEWREADVQPAFEHVRDERFLCDPARPDFPRRLTWLDPRQSCEMRAELVGWKLAQMGYPRPYKIFLSGFMAVSIPNTSKTASWTWHVASAVRVGKIAYVFDAAVEPSRPLTLEEWTGRLIGDPSSLEAVICDHAAFQPNSTCMGGPEWATASAIAGQQGDFESEWELQKEQGRDPEQALGNAPPWKKR